MAFIYIPFTVIKWLQTNIKYPQTVGSDLRVIEVWQALSSETLWQLALNCDVLYFMAQ